MKNLVLILGLAALLGLGYWLVTNDTAEAPTNITYNDETFTFSNENEQATIRYDNKTEHAQLDIAGQLYDLDIARSGSGARYVNTEKDIEFWEHQGEATVKINNETVFVGTIESDTDNDNVLTFNVGPEKVACTGVAPMECLMVNGEYFYDPITGFDFEPGYNYVLKIERTERENVPADASSYTYQLIEEVSKTPATATSTLEDTTWQWQKTQYNNDDVVEPNMTDAFTLSFATDGRFSATTDCNTLTGNYSIDGSSISFTEMAGTLKACPDIDSQETEFSKMLGEVNGHLITEDGNLALTLKYDSGSMIFTPITE